jgi:hypothetical protein
MNERKPEIHTFIVSDTIYTVKVYKHLSVQELIKLKEDTLRAIVDPNFVIKTDYPFEFIRGQ